MKSFGSVCILLLAGISMLPAPAAGREYHVSVAGSDTAAGTADAPFRSISKAAQKAMPGDVVTVHEGLYRERITPPRGGTADARIVYRAAPGETAEIRGSEMVTGWENVKEDTWKAVLPNTFFGDYNPFADPIRGDWFAPKGRPHHTAAVYLNGEWLIEAAALEEVLNPEDADLAWLHQAGRNFLLNVAWLRPDSAGEKTPATAFARKSGTQNASCQEGGDCIGFIQHGHWVLYEGVDFGEESRQMAIRAASATAGGIIEVRIGGPDGRVIGQCAVPNTGGWQSWRTFKVETDPVSGRKPVCLVFRDRDPVTHGKDAPLWFAEVEGDTTTIHAQFKGVNPNEETVEVNVRRTVFYPAEPGVDYITVRGFILRHAATQWAPPTAEQIGLIGTHWSKGWIIEDNIISHSRCTGITLGKYGDQWDNTSEDTAEGYVDTINRALENGWSRDNIGSHIVRNNTISHCEQAGLVGSMGAVFSTIAGNTIHDIHVQQFFTGAEMAGIKIHAAIDTTISDNRIYRTCRGIWLDWMTQGTRVTRNLLYENTGEDLFVEVNHGPFLVDNNFFLSRVSLLDMSQGGAYAHNLMTGSLVPRPELNRETPYHPAHTTAVAGLRNIEGGDSRFFNNIFAGGNGLVEYRKAALPMYMAGNVYMNGARPVKAEEDAVVFDNINPGVRIEETEDAVYLHLSLETGWRGDITRAPVTSERLGKAAIPELPWENPDGTPVRIDSDYSGRKRDGDNPPPGPLLPAAGEDRIKVWPK
jgi:alpha-L-arabinofuranosidase